MKNVTKILGLIILAVIIGFAMTACPNDSDTGGGGGGGGGVGEE